MRDIMETKTELMDLALNISDASVELSLALSQHANSTIKLYENIIDGKHTQQDLSNSAKSYYPMLIKSVELNKKIRELILQLVKNEQSSFLSKRIALNQQADKQTDEFIAELQKLINDTHP